MLSRLISHIYTLCSRVKRYHIQQTAMRRQVEIEDDLYDF
jgi:hypothetical protein